MKIFKEEQRFTQTWLIAIIAISTLIPVVTLVNEYIDGKTSLNSLLRTMGIIIIVSSLIFFFKLKTRIDENGIYYQFFPFHLSLKKIAWHEISSAKVRKYDPIYEYGGWGLKGSALWNRKKGVAINVSGDIGIQLQLKNGKKLLIGTQKEQAAKQVLATYKNNITKND